MNKIRIIYMGTPDFATATLEMLHHHPLIDIVQVVSMPDRPAGRGQDLKSPAVIEYAKNNKIPFFQTENINHELNWIDQFKNQKIDIIIVLAFAQFLSDKILALPLKGCFNIHTSLLPLYRGAAPIQYALLNGDTLTGVSIQKMVKKMDAGNIVHSNTLTISPFENGGSLSTKLKFLAALTCGEFIDLFLNNKLKNEIQDETKVSFAPTLKKDQGFLDFKKLSTEEALRSIKALDPWPGTFCFLNDKRLKVFFAETYSQKLSPGTISTAQGVLSVGCTNGSLRLTDIQWEGKKRSSDIDFINGIRFELNLTSLTKD